MVDWNDIAINVDIRMSTTTKKPRKAKNSRSNSRNGKPSSIADSIRRHFRVVPAVEAVFMATEGKIVHVFSVTAEHESKIYKKLMKQETLVEKDHPTIAFDFHTRVHQGRPAHRAVPFDAIPVFEK